MHTIYLRYKELIWYGNATAEASRVTNFQVCDYLGTRRRHLCYSDCLMTTFGDLASYRFFDDTYQSLGRSYRQAGVLLPPNPHEFNVLPNGSTFIQTVYQLRSLDLSHLQGPIHGFAWDGCFQEVDIPTGNELFSWCGLDHGLLETTRVVLSVDGKEGDRRGSGSAVDPFDYMHINAIDKSVDGDYLVTARHLDQVLLVAGPRSRSGQKTSSIIWRFGGATNEYEDAHLADLSRPHHARIVKMSHTETTFSVFNNQAEVHLEHGRKVSNAQVITVDNATRTMKSLRKYDDPDNVYVYAQGSVQVLSNGNIFVGWGFHARATEFAEDGTILSHISLSRHLGTSEATEDQQNYRTHKFDWKGRPQGPPKLLVYSLHCEQYGPRPLVAYASWNGATEVRSWQFSTSATLSGSLWMPAGEHLRTGFETKVLLEDRSIGLLLTPFHPLVMMRALDANRNVLATVTAKTFVPSDAIINDCDDEACLLGPSFDYNQSFSKAASCKVHAPARHALPTYIIVLLPMIVITMTLWTRRLRRRALLLLAREP